MSKKKIIGGLIFMVCFLGSSVSLVGAYPQWSIAAQSVFQRYDPPAPNEASVPLPNRMALLLRTSVNGSAKTPATTAKESGTTMPPSFIQSDQEEASTEVSPSQQNDETPLTEEDQSNLEEQAQSSAGETQSVSASASPSPAEDSLQQSVQSELKSNPIILDTEKRDLALAPTPSPGLPDTPIHSYYDQAGNPPTAPGLAMRQRDFQPEIGKMAYLTFDDGPYPSTTPKILAILAKETIQATFFDIGHRVELYPELLKAEYEQGNAIGNHTYSHNMATLYKGPQEFLADVKKSEEIIYQTLGIRPQIVRAPGGTVGNFTVSYFNTMDAAGYLMEDWNIDSGDTDAHLVPVNTLIQHVEQQIQGKTRVVILLHDLVGKTTTIEALPEIIDVLKKQGFSFGVLGPHVLPIVFPEGMHN
ncbi:MAG: polysaccharide deacetylase [Desulfosporosinus sp.]|nr:polysaccharide deacetylase [Desulfosporosinus sp.]